MTEHHLTHHSEELSLPQQLVFDLQKIVREQGMPNPEEKSMEFHSGDIKLPFQLFLWKTFDTPSLLMVSKSQELSIYDIRTIDTSWGQILWDKSLTPKQVEEAVTRIQQEQK